MTITVDLMNPTGARVSRVNDDFSVVYIRDEADPNAEVAMYIRTQPHEEAARQIAEMINIWCSPTYSSLAGTCEKLLAEEEQRRKEQPWYPDDSGEWVEIAPGDTPDLASDTVVDVLYADERELRRYTATLTFSHTVHEEFPDRNIVAYKPAKPAPVRYEDADDLVEAAQ